MSHDRYVPGVDIIDLTGHKWVIVEAWYHEDEKSGDDWWCMALMSKLRPDVVGGHRIPYYQDNYVV